MSKTIYRIISLLSVLSILAVFLAGCAGKEEEEESKDEISAAQLAEQLYDGLDVPPYEIADLDQSNFEYFAFVPYKEGYTAVSADALVNITPHSMVVIHLENGGGAELSEEVALNADPNKWLCVGSESVQVAYTDHYVVLVMSTAETASAITDRFGELAPGLDGMEMTVLKEGNSRYE